MLVLLSLSLTGVLRYFRSPLRALGGPVWQERDAAVAGLEAAEQEKESSKTRLKDLFAKYKAVQAVRGRETEWRALPPLVWPRLL